MELSVVIVNYNVKHFLEQCLTSVIKAAQDIDHEVFVVDNASSDGSCEMVKQKFSKVKLIQNSKNVGFSKANNQAIKQSTGNYVLLLNPDTVVQEDTFTKCLTFMNVHSDCGSMTVKMIDGKGNYLPESKRGFPSPWVSFFKIFGLTSLFPKSKIFARYYLGHLDKNSIHQIDVLPGAFMFIRQKALSKAGLLDEQFFMYGEDIDLSYRIIQAGFKNYYYPECQIIHYKGESTKKGSLNYVVIFYKAMILFAKKHFKSKKANSFIVLINIAIYFRAFLSVLRRVASKLWLPVIDIVIITAGVLTILPKWELYRFQSSDIYPENYVFPLVTFYIATWIFSLWINGSYDKPQKLYSASKGTILGTLFILAVYSILPNEMRFSRAIILIAGLWALISTQLLRLVLTKIHPKLITSRDATKRIAVIGSSTEASKVKVILDNTGINYNYTGNFLPTTLKDQPNSISNNQLEEFIRINNVDEIIFCANDITMQSIVTSMLLLSSLGIEYKIAPAEGSFIIGSNSIEGPGELYSLDIKAIGTPSSRRNKRLFDIISSLGVIVIWPLTFLFLKNPIKLLINTIKVLVGFKTWIGYNTQDKSTIVDLPTIKPGVFPFRLQNIKAAIAESEINLYYARNYSPSIDLVVLWHSLF